MTVAATLHLSEAADRTWDAVVVGAGPAGSLAARELARRGRRVLLADKASFPRYKVCGCCLNGRALATLAEVGLDDLVPRLGAVPLHALRLATAARESLLHLPQGVAVSREAFDAALVEAAIAAGTAFLPQTRVTLGPLRTGERTLLLQQGNETVPVATRLLLAANGLGGQLHGAESNGAPQVKPNSRIGAGTIAPAAPDFYEPGIIYMACGAGGYVGLVRLEDRRLDIAAAFDPSLVRRAGGPGKAAARLLGELSWPAIPGLAELPWRGTPGLTRRAPRIAAERLFVLGDAASYIEPFTGEGIAWALAGAAALAPLANRAIERWEPLLAQRWRACYRQLIGRRQVLCRATARALRRPKLIAVIVAVLAHAPWLAAPFVYFLNRHGGVHHESSHHRAGNGPSPLRHAPGQGRRRRSGALSEP
jgi:flavin-dependent dehydrogenase